MADEEQLRILRQGRDAWNEWRGIHESNVVNLSVADLAGADLSGYNLARANLSGAYLIRGADLSGADLSGSDLRRSHLGGGANLSGAILVGADVRRAYLSGAKLANANLLRTDLGEADLSNTDLSGANLVSADLRRAYLVNANLVNASLAQANLGNANLDGTDFDKAMFSETILSNVDLSECKNLESISHDGPSSIDMRTLHRSGMLPLAFLRGVGLPDMLIDYMPSLLKKSLQFYTCFISYSTKDSQFAERLHADLQDKGVRCWFAPHDLPIGAKTWDAIDEAIRLRDKLFLILSEASIASDWVEDEVNKAHAEERERKVTVLFPVRIDDNVMTTLEPWARRLRDQRNIGDFRRWKDHDAYQEAFDRVLRDLKMKTT